jgi:hypothetical protein
MEPMALFLLMSVILVDVRRHCSRFENVFFFLSPYCGVSVVFVCAAPLVMCSLYKEHTTSGVAHTKGHRDAAILREKKERTFSNWEQ